MALIALVTLTGCNKDDGIEDITTKPTGTIEGHDYVDLGLPSGLKWATCNIGASSPDEYGNYYAWGETTTKSSYTEENSVTFRMHIADISGNPQYDAARANWGGTWRMPTDNEFNELIDNCQKENTKFGYKMVGPNGNSIIIPRYTGCIDGSSQTYMIDTYYWSSYGKEPFSNQYFSAFCPSFDKDESGITGYWNFRSRGIPIRPVSD